MKLNLKTFSIVICLLLCFSLLLGWLLSPSSDGYCGFPLVMKYFSLGAFLVSVVIGFVSLIGLIASACAIWLFGQKNASWRVILYWSVALLISMAVLFFISFPVLSIYALSCSPCRI